MGQYSVEDSCPIVQRAIMRRVDTEPGVKICSIKMKHHKGDCLRVGLQYFILGDDGTELIGRSLFELPEIFEHSHLLNEIDQVCEQIKAAKKEHFGLASRGSPSGTEKTLQGTGLRGLWPGRRLPGLGAPL